MAHPSALLKSGSDSRAEEVSEKKKGNAEADEAAKAVAVGDVDQVANDLESEGDDGNPPGATAALEPQDSRVDGKHIKEKKCDGNPFPQRRELGVRSRVDNPKAIERSAWEEEQKRSEGSHESGEIEEEAEG